jgi:hypothetical protein
MKNRPAVLASSLSAAVACLAPCNVGAATGDVVMSQRFLAAQPTSSSSTWITTLDGSPD